MRTLRALAAVGLAARAVTLHALAGVDLHGAQPIDGSGDPAIPAFQNPFHRPNQRSECHGNDRAAVGCLEGRSDCATAWGEELGGSCLTASITGGQDEFEGLHDHTAYDDDTEEVTIANAPACDAIQHNVYWGDLASVSSYAYRGVACDVGASGTATFDPGAGAKFFLVVGNDRSIEGSYGHDSASAERPEDTGTPVCPCTQQLSATCE